MQTSIAFTVGYSGRINKFAEWSLYISGFPLYALKKYFTFISITLK